MKIVITGVIGCGKTFFCKVLKERYGYTIVEEHINHAKLQEYYSDPERYAYTFQMYHLDKRLKAYNEQTNTDVTIYDQSIHTDIVYGNANRNEMGEMYAEYLKKYNECIQTVENPHYIIYLKCTPEVCLKRIQTRNRSGESNISIEYLRKLNNLYDTEWMEMMKKHDINVITLDWNDIVSEKNIIRIWEKQQYSNGKIFVYSMIFSFFVLLCCKLY